MFLAELFTEDDNPFLTPLPALDKIPSKHFDLIQNLARFHHVDVTYNQKLRKWFLNGKHSEGLSPFIKDATHIMAANRYGTGNNVVETVVDEAPNGPSKKESVLNKGVEKMLVAMQAWQDARDEAIKFMDPIPPRPKLDVAVVVKDYPNNLAYGTIKFIGRNGLIHVKLNGGKLKDWASGDEIAVRPNEVHAAWDPALQGKTTVHREYDDLGNRTVREAETVRDRKTGQEYNPADEFEKLQKDPDYVAQMKRMGREEGKGWPKRQDKEVNEAKGLNKRVKIVKGSYAGQTGSIGEVRHGLFKGAPKQFTVDLDNGGNIMLPKEALRLIKNTP